MTLIRWIGAVVVAIVAVVSAALAIQVVEDQRTITSEEAAPPGDRARDIIATFTGGQHLYVAPEMATTLTDAQKATVSAAAAEADPATFIALVGDREQSGYDGIFHLLSQLQMGVGQEGVYLVWDGDPRTGYAEETDGLSGYLSSEMTGQKDKALLRFIDQVEAEIAPYGEDGHSEGGDYWGGVGGGIAAGLLMVSAGYAALMLLLGTVRALAGSSFILPGRWRDFFGGGD